MPLNNNNKHIFLSSIDFVSLDGFLGDISDDEVRHRKSSSHRVPTGRRKPEKVGNSEFDQPTCICGSFLVCDLLCHTISVKAVQKNSLSSSGHNGLIDPN